MWWQLTNLDELSFERVLALPKAEKKIQAIIFTSIDGFSADKASSIAEYPKTLSLGKTPFI